MKKRIVSLVIAVIMFILKSIAEIPAIYQGETTI